MFSHVLLGFLAAAFPNPDSMLFPFILKEKGEGTLQIKYTWIRLEYLSVVHGHTRLQLSSNSNYNKPSLHSQLAIRTFRISWTKAKGHFKTHHQLSTLLPSDCHKNAVKLLSCGQKRAILPQISSVRAYRSQLHADHDCRFADRTSEARSQPSPAQKATTLLCDRGHLPPLHPPPNWIQHFCFLKTQKRDADTLTRRPPLSRSRSLRPGGGGEGARPRCEVAPLSAGALQPACGPPHSEITPRGSSPCSTTGRADKGRHVG